MANSILSASEFHNEATAFEFVESQLWPNGPVCPFCGETERIGRLTGKTTRPGLCKCYACRKQFTVRIGTIFEASHAPLRVWLQAIHLMCSSKKGISTRQLQRTLRVGMKTAWFLGHRIRHAMTPASDVGPIGGAGKIVEADETFLGKSPKTRKRPGQRRAIAILSLVERGGATRSVPLKGDPSRDEIVPALFKHVHPDSTLHTDGAQHYKYTSGAVAKHESVDHNKQYARTNAEGIKVHTNTLEGYFSVFKRGLIGVYQHMSEKHLHRYWAEFDFRQNTRERLGVNDVARAEIALKGFHGKRLTYRTTHREMTA